MFYSIYFTLRDLNSFQKLMNLLFPFVFIALFFQVYSLIVKSQFVHIFIAEVTSINGVFDEEGKGNVWERPIESSHIVFLCLLISLFYLKTKTSNFSKIYLICINLVSYLSLFLTGSRSWLLGVSTIMFLFLLTEGRRNPKLLTTYALSAFLFINLVLFIPTIRNQIDNAISRYETISLVAKGDKTGGGTIQRYDVRAPLVMEAFKNSNTVFGAGFSDAYFEHNDQHIGYHNLLLNTGIAGIILFLLFFMNIFYKLNNAQKRLKDINLYSKGLNIFNLGIIGMLIINTGTQFIGFDVQSGFNKMFIISVILCMANTVIRYPVQSSPLPEKILPEIY